MEFILGLVDDIDMPNLGICMDTGHANLGDLGSRAIRMAGKLSTTHLQEISVSKTITCHPVSVSLIGRMFFVL